jgi:CHRD domain
MALSRSLALAVVLAGSALFSASALAQELRLTGAQEVPPNASTVVGTGNIKVDADGNVSGSVSAPLLKQPHAAHIHLGAPGQNGPPIITLAGGDIGTWTVPDGAKLTPEQLQSYKAGNLYVNVHTQEHPGGEIRTQLKP